MWKDPGFVRLSDRSISHSHAFKTHWCKNMSVIHFLPSLFKKYGKLQDIDKGHSFSVLEVYSPVKGDLQINGGTLRIQKKGDSHQRRVYNDIILEQRQMSAPTLFPLAPSSSSFALWG